MTSRSSIASTLCSSSTSISISTTCKHAIIPNNSFFSAWISDWGQVLSLNFFKRSFQIFYNSCTSKESLTRWPILSHGTWKPIWKTKCWKYRLNVMMEIKMRLECIKEFQKDLITTSLQKLQCFTTSAIIFHLITSVEWAHVSNFCKRKKDILIAVNSVIEDVETAVLIVIAPKYSNIAILTNLNSLLMHLIV